jgi:RNA polymerase sigma-70 factor, ECF subfamily
MNVAGTSVDSFGACCARRAKPAYTLDPFELVRAFGARVFAIARHITQNDDDAGDVLIEAFLEVCPDLEDCPNNEQAWLRLVAVAVRKAFLKLRAAVKEHKCPDQVDASEELVIRELFVWGDDYQPSDSSERTTRLLEHGLRSLDPMCRTIFVLKDIEGIRVEQIATIVNRSAAAVEVCLLRARLRLGEMLGRQPIQQP